MSKPPGLSLFKPDGSVGFHVTHPTRTEDEIWDAVSTARAEGWTIERFIREAKEGWVESLECEAKTAIEEARKA